MTLRIRALESGDETAIRSILNHYVRTGFAAFAQERIGREECDRLIAASCGYPFFVLEKDEKDVVGFARLRPYHRFQTFRRTAVWTCFILPEHTGSGHGKALLDRILQHAEPMGIQNILAEISSENANSLQFHSKLGFRECGRLKGIGRKFGRDFDIVLMQKVL